ncbi:unnamed protein product, partial [Prorocentrum cordatum]
VPRGWRVVAQHGPPELRRDRGIVLEAVRRDWEALELADESMRSDPELVRVAVRQDWRATIHAIGPVETSTMVEAVQQDWRAIDMFLREDLPQGDLDALATLDALVNRVQKHCVKNTA